MARNMNSDFFDQKNMFALFTPSTGKMLQFLCQYFSVLCEYFFPIMCLIFFPIAGICSLPLADTTVER